VGEVYVCNVEDASHPLQPKVFGNRVYMVEFGPDVYSIILENPPSPRARRHQLLALRDIAANPRDEVADIETGVLL
jgi:hypothetical protein